MAFPAGALKATITVGAPIDIAGAAGILVSLHVRPDVPAGLVWAATGDMIEPWSASPAVGEAPVTSASLAILADRSGVLTSITEAGAPAMGEIRDWPLVATWVTRQSATGAPTRHVRHFNAPAAGTTLDLDLLPADGVTVPATVTYAQSINISAGSEEDIAVAVDAYLTANPPAGAVASVNGEIGAVILDAADVGADPAGTAAAAVAAHEAAVDPHPTYTTAAEAAAAAPVQSVAGRTGAVTLSLDDAADTATRLALTPAERTKLGQQSGTNTGDQDLSGLAPASGQAAANALAAAASVTVPATHSMHTLTMTGNTTLAFANPTAGHAFTLKLSGAFAPTFPASVTWAGGSAPTYASGKVYVFATFDAGTSWIGSAL